MNLEDLDRKWDLIVIGGGITGAGIYSEATRAGFRVLLLEQRDFAWGTSSRSSKLVHGGLRYLSQGRFMLTRASVRARDRLLREARGLVEPLGFLMPIYRKFGAKKRDMSIGLTIYDLLAQRRQHHYLDMPQFSLLAPHIRQEDLCGGFHFADAQTDDARLVLRLIEQASKKGSQAINGARVCAVTRLEDGSVSGVDVEDVETQTQAHFTSPVVINATGAWAERLHPSPQKGLHLRPLRGSHLVFPGHVFPLAQAIGFGHPKDQRPVFVFPWEGATLVGTTDVDHGQDLNMEPRITREETDYLMQALDFYFPTSDLTEEDIVSTLAGVRPVLSSGRKAPSAESREHAVWTDHGLITVTGGKLTTFRELSWDALRAARRFLPDPFSVAKRTPVFPPDSQDPPPKPNMDAITWQRLQGRYGHRAASTCRHASDEDLQPIPGTRTLWAEIPLAAENAHVRHLDDLLLRRTRIGLLTPKGGEDYLDRIQIKCADLLNWSPECWESEKARYLEIWRSTHAPLA